MTKPIEDYTDDELVIELADKIKEEAKYKAEIAELARVENAHKEKHTQALARKMALQSEISRRGKKGV